MEKVITKYAFLLRFSVQKIVGHLYFFFNSLGLKGGLLYTNLLTPFLLVWIINRRYLASLLKICSLFLFYGCIHLAYGVDRKSFLISNALVVSTIIFVIAAYIYLKHYSSLRTLMQQILIFNFVLVVVAIPFYFLDYTWQKWFWYTNLFTTQKTFTRLALFTFEASYYSLLLIPLCYYYYLRIFLSMQLIKGRTVLLMITLPLVLSLSFGVIGGTFITAILMCWIHRHQLLRYRLPLQILFLVLSVAILTGIILLVFFSDTLIVKRMLNVFTGIDTSTNGRTFEAFQIAWKAAGSKSIWFGGGLGQTKWIIPEIIRSDFPHWGKMDIYRIPNAVAETLAIFGVSGLIIRFGVLLYLFFKTDVKSNYFRLALFIFIFIYQFTGSYITNIVEYVIWLMAFVNCFPEFDKKPVSSRPVLHEKSAT